MKTEAVRNHYTGPFLACIDHGGPWLHELREYLLHNARAAFSYLEDLNLPITAVPLEGTYRFSVTNGMRDSAITGLKDIGLRIEYSNMK